jgi:hypothetical protein
MTVFCAPLRPAKDGPCAAWSVPFSRGCRENDTDQAEQHFDGRVRPARAYQVCPNQSQHMVMVRAILVSIYTQQRTTAPTNPNNVRLIHDHMRLLRANVSGAIGRTKKPYQNCPGKEPGQFWARLVCSRRVSGPNQAITRPGGPELILSNPDQGGQCAAAVISEAALWRPAKLGHFIRVFRVLLWGIWEGRPFRAKRVSGRRQLASGGEVWGWEPPPPSPQPLPLPQPFFDSPRAPTSGPSCEQKVATRPRGPPA